MHIIWFCKPKMCRSPAWKVGHLFFRRRIKAASENRPANLVQHSKRLSDHRPSSSWNWIPLLCGLPLLCGKLQFEKSREEERSWQGNQRIDLSVVRCSIWLFPSDPKQTENRIENQTISTFCLLPNKLNCEQTQSQSQSSGGSWQKSFARCLADIVGANDL